MTFKLVVWWPADFLFFSLFLNIKQTAQRSPGLPEMYKMCQAEILKLHSL